MRGISLLVVSLAGLGALLLVAGCAASPSPSPSPTPPSSPTIGQFADAGKTVFAGRCAKCHGDQGQGISGPAIIGQYANLGKYNTAQSLLSFVDTTMPFDAPGSLSHQEYLQVLCYLLVQNNFASSSTTFNENGLASIQLK